MYRGCDQDMFPDDVGGSKRPQLTTVSGSGRCQRPTYLSFTDILGRESRYESLK